MGNHKEIAAEAIDAALTNAHKLEPTRESRYLIADLETARDAVALIQELVRPRKKKAKKKGGPLDDPNVTR